MDPFLSALEDLSQALSAGEDPEQAIAEVAEEDGLAAHALRNRAVRAFGPLDTYKERQTAAKKEREQSAVRANPALAAATFLAEVSNLSPKLPPTVWEAQVKRLAAELGVDPAVHRTAIERVRRRY